MQIRIKGKDSGDKFLWYELQEFYQRLLCLSRQRRDHSLQRPGILFTIFRHLLILLPQANRCHS